jgi:two-component system cell cycle sensor histidine kinase/response regulator CckA
VTTSRSYQIKHRRSANKVLVPGALPAYSFPTPEPRTKLSVSSKKPPQVEQAERVELTDATARAAHDFKNILAAIAGLAETTRFELPAEHAAQAHLSELLAVVEQGTRLSDQLLGAAAARHPNLEELRLTDVLRELWPTVRKLMGNYIELRLEADVDPGLIKADRSEIEQVILNLASNSRDAMPAGGWLTVQLTRARIEGAKGETGAMSALLMVRDTGHGMSEETQRQIFAPYFTTKRGGTGIGLTNVADIVRRYGGTISVISALGEGTTFKVSFPLATRAS